MTLSKKVKKKLLLVADAKVAKFYLVEDFKIKELVTSLDFEEINTHHHRQELRTGQFVKAGTGSRFFDPHSDAKDLDRKDFSKEVVHELSKLFEQDKYDQLIIVCGPKVLGDIRKDMPASFKSIEIKEFNKELTHHSDKQIQEEVLDEMKWR